MWAWLSLVMRWWWRCIGGRPRAKLRGVCGWLRRRTAYARASVAGSLEVHPIRGPKVRCVTGAKLRDGCASDGIRRVVPSIIGFRVALPVAIGSVEMGHGVVSLTHCRVELWWRAQLLSVWGGAHGPAVRCCRARPSPHGSWRHIWSVDERGLFGRTPTTAL